MLVLSDFFYGSKFITTFNVFVRYRDAGAEVINVLLQFSGIVERASIDEAYIDLTQVVEDKMIAFKR